LENVLEEVQGEESRETIDKRKLLALAAVAAAGLAIKPLAEEAHAATGDSLIIGKTDNEASFGDMTRLITHAGDKSCGFGVDNTTNSVAIQGCSVGIGVAGASEKSHGVHGGSVYGDGIDAHSVYGTGVIGHTDENGGPGVMGWTSNPNGVGVCGGGGEKGTGVRGLSGEAGGIGVHAFSEKGTALKVDGKGNARAKVDSAPQADIESGLIPLPSVFAVENIGEKIVPPPTHHPPIGILGMCPQGMGMSGFQLLVKVFMEDQHLGLGYME